MHFIVTLIAIVVLGGAGIFVIISYLNKKSLERKKEIEEEIRQEKIRREIDDLIDSVIRDWNASLYPDKVETPYKTVIYKFENGNTIFYQGEKLIYETSTKKITYTLAYTDRTKFTGVFNRIVEIINNGKTATRKSKNNSYSYGSRSKFTDGGKTTYPPNKTSSQKNSDNPRQRRYDILMETIKLRKENLAKMSRNHSDRPAMEQELNVAERKAAEIKKELQKS